MQDFQELAPDEETFRRVWKRVMPDESASPIVVHTPGQAAVSEPPPRMEAQDETILREMLVLLEMGLSASELVVRRQPGAWPLKESLQRSAGQAKSVWFLMTGQQWKNRGRQRTENLPQGHLLREQYIRELQFSKLCRENASRAEEEGLREIVPALEAASGRRRKMIRNLLSAGRF